MNERMNERIKEREERKRERKKGRKKERKIERKKEGTHLFVLPLPPISSLQLQVRNKERKKERN